jgi:hypothetical protein
VMTRREKTGDFVVDHYTRRQTKIIKEDGYSLHPRVSKRELYYILDKAEKLEDFDTYNLISEHYDELFSESGYDYPEISKEDFHELLLTGKRPRNEND